MAGVPRLLRARATRVVAPAGETVDRLGGGTGYGVDPGGDADYQARAIQAAGGGSRFVVATPDGEVPVTLAVPGPHNVANATAALASIGEGLGRERSLELLARYAAALASFPGMARRLELKGTCDGARVYDDYAHHPTEVAASLAALRELPHRRLIAIFQPHLYSRTKALAPRFGRALATADVIGVLDVYAAREQPVGPLAGVSGLDVARAAASAAPGRPVLWIDELDRAAGVIREQVRPQEGDLLVTVGAGDVFKVGDELTAGGVS